MACLLAVFQVFLIVVAGSLQRSGSFEQLGNLLPSFARQLLGPSLISFMSFSGIVSLGYFHVAVIGSLVGLSIALGTIPASEIEAGFIDLLLSRPVARHWIITRTFVVMLICTIGVIGMMLLGTWAGLNALADRQAGWPAAGLILSLAANLGLLMFCWNGVAVAIGSASRRRSVAGGIAGLLALTMFLLDYVARAWPPAERLAWLSPFRYYSPFELLLGDGLSIRNLLVLAATAIAGFAIAYLIFSRRDISH
jgi:ABC-2 type transport system permease protein